MSDRNDLVSSELPYVSALVFVLAVALAPTALFSQSVVPVALDFSADGRSLFVANRDGGSVARLHGETHEFIDEFEVQGQPIDLLVLKEQILILDQQHPRLRVFSSSGEQIAEHILGSQPARMTSNEDGDQLFIASTFGRELLSFAREGRKWVQRSSCKLPFSPLEVKWFDDQLIVAGAFEAELALLDCSQIETQMKLLHTVELRGHNIRGIELVGDEVFLTLQEISPLAHSSRDDVHWGNLLANKLVHFPVAGLIEKAKRTETSPRSPSETIQRNRGAQRVHIELGHVELGQPGSGSGDPGRLLYDASTERLFILLAGSSELLEFDPAKQEVVSRTATGQRPTAIASSSSRLAIANRYSNSVTWIAKSEAKRTDQQTPVTILSEGNPTTVQRGEQLFFDSRLSHDGWMSCHSCHSDGHSSGQLNDNQSDGGFGAAKRIPSLLGVAHTEPWGWTGQVASLEQQVKNSIKLTMHGTELEAEQVEALVAFMKSLPAPGRTKFLSSNDDFDELAKGEKLFRSLGCAACHQPKRYFTSPTTYSVGWEDRQGNQHFNPPSLLGVRMRSKLFHDGRSDLESMIKQGEHKLPRELTPSERTSLLTYLRSL